MSQNQRKDGVDGAGHEREETLAQDGSWQSELSKARRLIREEQERAQRLGEREWQNSSNESQRLDTRARDPQTDVKLEEPPGPLAGVVSRVVGAIPALKPFSKKVQSGQMSWIRSGRLWFPVPPEVYEEGYITEELSTHHKGVYSALWYLAWRYNKNNHLLPFYVPDERLATAAGVSSRTVQRARKELGRLGLLECWCASVRDRETGRFITVHFYQLVLPIPRRSNAGQ